jgi:hypothetical protein
MRDRSHLIWDMTSDGKNNVLIMDHGYPELVYVYRMGLTANEALTCLRGIYVNNVTRNIDTNVSVVYDFRPKEENDMRTIDVMDDVAMAIEVLNR